MVARKVLAVDHLLTFALDHVGALKLTGPLVRVVVPLLAKAVRFANFFHF